MSGNYWLSFIIFKSIHIIEYGVLFLLWRFALYKNKNSIKIAVLIAVLYGVTDELHQTMVATREGKIRDIFIDSLGVFIFWKFLLEKAEEMIKRHSLLRKVVPF